MKKSEWGPKLWSFLHACSFALPETPSEDQKKAFEDLLNALKVLVPCPECREHYCNYIKGSPAPLECGGNLQAWLVEFHNNVNRRIGKPEFSHADAKTMYGSGQENSLTVERFGANPTASKKSSTSLLFLIIFIVAAAIGCFFIVRRYRRH
jgi:hypothetical protein